MASSSLPSVVALCRPGDEFLGVRPNGRLACAFGVMDSPAKFAVETATTVRGYVHIRSCYTNKYWVRSSAREYWIEAGAKERNEEKESWNCTLFRASFEGNNRWVFQHYQTGQLLVVLGRQDAVLIQEDGVQRALFEARDYQKYVKLPRYVAFQADNGNYYQHHIQDRGRYFQQARSNELGSSEVVQEISYTRAGGVRIRNVASGEFWRASPNWIRADSGPNDNIHNGTTIFTPTLIDSDTLALRSNGNQLFCRRFANLEKKVNCLAASINTIISETRLKVVEPVLTRSVDATEFRLNDARIYEEQALLLGQNSAKNLTNTVNTTTLGFKYTDTKSSTWSNSITVGVGVKIKFNTNILFIAENGIEVQTQVSNTYQWGETRESTKEIESTYSATVPPRTEVIVRLMATRGKCDVPFTYTQVDTLTDGRRIRNTYTNGQYTGVNMYSIRYETIEKPID